MHVVVVAEGRASTSKSMAVVAEVDVPPIAPMHDVASLMWVVVSIDHWSKVPNTKYVPVCPLF